MNNYNQLLLKVIKGNIRACTHTGPFTFLWIVKKKCNSLTQFSRFQIWQNWCIPTDQHAVSAMQCLISHRLHNWASTPGLLNKLWCVFESALKVNWLEICPRCVVPSGLAQQVKALWNIRRSDWHSLLAAFIVSYNMWRALLQSYQ